MTGEERVSPVGSYLCAASKNPPNGRIDSVEEFLKGFGRRCPFTIDDVNGPNVHFLASGPAEVILGLLLWHYPARSRSIGPKAAADLLGRVAGCDGLTTPARSHKW